MAYVNHSFVNIIRWMKTSYDKSATTLKTKTYEKLKGRLKV